MKVEIKDLENAALLYAVLLSLGYSITKEQSGMFWCMHKAEQYVNSWLEEYPDIINWEFVIPVIEKHRIEFEWINKGTRLCAILTDCNGQTHFGYGKDYIEATLKCICVSKLGLTVDIPQELLNSL